MNTKSIIKKLVQLLIIGLTVAILLHPVLHEFGHIFATVLVGGNLKQTTLFPIQSVLINSTSLSAEKIIAIGLCGTALPAVLSLLIWPHRFSLWYGVLIHRLICLYSSTLDIFYTVLFIYGVQIKNSDVATMLSYNSNASFFIIVFHCILVIILCFAIRKMLKNRIPLV